METSMNKLFVLLFTLTAATAFAGHSEGNGGDMCENRFKLVREDLVSWLHRGGGRTLTLPTSTSADAYMHAMLENIALARVACVDQELAVGGNPKTCVNTVSAEGEKRIVCNARRFLETNESDQYVLVHHEYAGLSGYETTINGESDYSVSNQISGSLENQVVKKLVVRQIAPRFCQEDNIVGMFAGRFKGSPGRFSKEFAVKIIVFPATEAGTPENPCPPHRVEYSRPDLVSGAGMIIATAKLDLIKSQLTIQSVPNSTTGVPGHNYLFIQTNGLSSFGFYGRMEWWSETGEISMRKCSDDKDRVSDTGTCY
jgi:hypothetical protein